MKRERAAVIFLSVVVVIVLVVLGYGYYRSEQTRALLAERQQIPAVERYATIQEALKTSAPESSESAERNDTEVDSATEPAEDPAFVKTLNDLRHAEATFEALRRQFQENPAWQAIQDDLMERPIASWTEDDWEQLRQYLSEHDALLAQARAMAAGTGPLYPLDLSLGYDVVLPHLAIVRSMTRLLRASAIAQAHDGNDAGAINDIMASAHLGARLDEEPLLISQLVHTAIDRIMRDTVIDVYTAGQIPADLLHQLARYYGQRDAVAQLRETWQMEGTMGLDYLDSVMNGGWQQGRERMEGFWPHSDKGTPRDSYSWSAILYSSPFARPWQHQDMLTYDRLMNDFGQLLDKPYYETRDAYADLEAQVAALPFTRVFTRNMLPSMDSILRLIARDQAQEQLFFLGAAVENYAIEHGNFPASLEDVLGQAHGTSLIDPHTGAPFRYEVSGNGFTLYSVGPNLTDDGGNHNVHLGDIVWRGEVKPKAGIGLVAGG